MASRKATRAVKTAALSFHPSKQLTIIVGKDSEQQQFLVHEGIICGRSEFFRRAMNGNWAEKEERVVRLPEDDPSIFDIYVNLIYTNLVPTNPSEQPKASKELCNEQTALCSLYVLCEKLQDVSAKNCALQALLTVVEEKDSGGKKWVPGVVIVNAIYAGTVKGSLGRLLMVDFWSTVDTKYLSDKLDDLTKDFLGDLAIAFRNERSSSLGNTARSSDGSKYLEKED